MTLGDFWGMTDEMKGYNEQGVSIIISQTSKGKELLNRIGKDFYIQKEDIRFVLKNNEMYYKYRKKPCDYDRFISNLNEYGLEYAVNRIRLSPKERMKKKIKKFLPRKIHIF